MALDPAFWPGKRVLVTGHTGFKGSWLGLLLEYLDARTSGIALAPSTDPSLYLLLSPWPHLTSTITDIRDPHSLSTAVSRAEPEIVIHMASVATVRGAFAEPKDAFATNVLGTANLFESLRECATPPEVILVVTTDKVYATTSGSEPHVETDRLGGDDPYSASKVGQELVTTVYRKHYFDPGVTRVATARAGNVIGGGDWAPDRIVADYVRSVASSEPLLLRNPNAVRPWQHVLDALFGYLTYVECLAKRVPGTPDSLNFSPTADETCSVAELLEGLGMQRSQWELDPDARWEENQTLRLNSELAGKTIGWKSTLSLADSLALTSDWYNLHAAGHDPRQLSMDQIDSYMKRL